MRIEPRPARDYPWYLQPFFWSQQRRYGQVAFQNLSSKFNGALDVPPQGFCRRPDA